MTTKQPNILAEAAALVEKEGAAVESVPWFRRPDRLLASVLRHARHDKKFSRMLVEEVGRWAAADMKTRDALLGAMKGKRRGRRATPVAEHEMLLDHYAVLREHFGLSFEAAIASLASHTSWAGLGEDGIRSRLTTARRVLKRR